MKKKILCFCTLLIIFTAASPCVLRAAETKTAPKPIQVPNPLELKSDWIKYFETDPENIGPRTEILIQSLKDLSTTQAVMEDEKILPMIDRVIIDINSYDTERKRLPRELIEETPVDKVNYSLEDFQEIGEKLYSIKTNQTEQALRRALEKQKINQEEAQLDTIFSSYKAITVHQSQKLVLGLEIMSLSLRSEIDKYLLEHVDAKIEKLLSQKELYSAELKSARKQIVLNPKLLASVEKLIHETDSQLETLQRSVDDTQQSYIVADNEAKPLLRQQYLGAATKVTEAKSALLLQKIKKEFFLLEKEHTRKKLSVLHRQISEHKVFFKETQTKTALWKIISLHELDKSIVPDEKISQKKELLLQAEENLQTVERIEKELFLSHFMLNQLTYLLQEKYTSFGDKIRNYWHSFTGFFKDNAEFMNTTLFKMGVTKVTPWLLIKLVIFISISYLLAWVTRRSIRKYGQKQRRASQAGIYAISKLAFYCIFFLGIIISVATIGIDFTAFAVIAGALSVGIGFGLQSIFNNFVSGILLLVEKSLRVGDFIQLDSGEKGTIREIRVRSTLIRTYDNIEIIVPNFDLISKKVTNWTLSEKVRRVHVPFSVAFGTDKDRVRELIISAAKKVPITLPDKEPDVWLMKMGDNGLEFELIVWVNEHLQGIPIMATMARFMWTIEQTLMENDIEIPYPVRDVRIKEPVSKDS